MSIMSIFITVAYYNVGEVIASMIREMQIMSIQDCIAYRSLAN